MEQAKQALAQAETEARQAAYELKRARAHARNLSGSIRVIERTLGKMAHLPAVQQMRHGLEQLQHDCDLATQAVRSMEEGARRRSEAVQEAKQTVARMKANTQTTAGDSEHELVW